MIRKMIPVVMLMTVLMQSGHATAQQTLRAFTADDFHPKILATSVGDLRVETTPLYGGSDRSALLLSERAESLMQVNTEVTPVEATISLMSFDAPDAILPGDELVGLVLAASPFQLGISDSGKSAKSVSFVSLPKSDSFDYSLQFQPFRIRLPAASASKRFDLVLNMHKCGNFALANLKIERGGTPATAPVPTVPAASAVPVNMIEQTLRFFSGNDFNSHVFDSSMEGPDVKAISLFGGQAGVDATVFLPSQPPRILPILAIDDPGVTRPDYAIAGEISYAGVQGDSEIDGYGYLEMQSDFADGTTTFTRTTADSGPLRIIRGRSGARPFLLPFHSDKRPTRIRMNLVMSGRGIVSMTILRLVQYAPPVVASTTAHADSSRLFSPRLIWIPAMVLPFFSLILMMEPLVRRGKGRRIVMAWIWTSFVFAQIAFAWCMAAWGHGLPIREFAPPLLISILVLCCTLAASRRTARRYRDAELKRMQLMDAV